MCENDGEGNLILVDAIGDADLRFSFFVVDTLIVGSGYMDCEMSPAALTGGRVYGVAFGTTVPFLSTLSLLASFLVLAQEGCRHLGSFRNL